MTQADKKMVSVILTNYNHKQYLEQAFDSVQAQTYSNIEIVIVDDCSTDGSQDLIQEIEAHVCPQNSKFPVKVLFLEKNTGKWNALNKGIEMASGELITLQDADDVSCPERIDRQVRALEATGTWHNLCGFFHCFTSEDMDKNRDYKAPPSYTLPVMNQKEVLRLVHQGYKTPGINHYFTGDFETHGATSLFYRQLWQNGMRFLPDSLGLRVQFAEDSDHNTRLTLICQKTSVLLEKQYCYRRGSSTNNAFKLPL